MPKAIYAFIAIGFATVAMPGFAQSQADTWACAKARGCIHTSTERYNQCVELALRRGQLLTRSDRHSLDSFVQACVAGRIPR